MLAAPARACGAGAAYITFKALAAVLGSLTATFPVVQQLAGAMLQQLT